MSALRNLQGTTVNGLNINEIGPRRTVEHVARHRGWLGKITGNIEDLVAQVAGMRGSQLAVAFDIPLLQ